MALWTVLLVLVTLVWGNTFIAIKAVVAYVSPLQLVTVRFVPAALIFGAFLVVTRGPQVWHLVRTEGWRLALLGLTGAVLFNAFVGWGQTRIPANVSSLIIALNPGFTYTFSVLFLGERFSWRQAAGLAVAFGGLAVVVLWGSGGATAMGDVAYALIMMLASVCWAAYTVLGKALVTRHPPLLVTGTMITFAGLFSLVFVGSDLFARLQAAPASFWLASLFLALFSSVLAFVIWFGALKRMPATRVAGFTYLVPLFSVVFSWLLLGEPITPALVVGAAILIGGVWLVNRHRAEPQACDIDRMICG
jgi:drug/metabolite transporter (DMT)-like permease